MSGNLGSGGDLADRSLPFSVLRGDVTAMMLGFPPTIKDLMWVGGTGADTASESNDQQGHGRSPATPFKTIAYAVANTQAPNIATKRTDIGIVVLPAHTETISGANGWNFGAAGIYVKGLGWGSRRPTITLDTVDSAQILLDQDASVIDNMIFVNGVATTVAMFAVSGDDCKILNNRIRMDVGGLNALIGILVGVAATDNLEIAYNQIESDTIGADSGVSYTEVSDRLNIHDNDIDGDFADACLHNPTGKVMTKIRILNNILINTNAGEHCIEHVSDCLGVIAHNLVGSDLAAAGGLTAIDGGLCNIYENYGHDATNDTSALLNPAVDSS